MVGANPPSYLAILETAFWRRSSACLAASAAAAARAAASATSAARAAAAAATRAASASAASLAALVAATRSNTEGAIVTPAPAKEFDGNCSTDCGITTPVKAVAF